MKLREKIKRFWTLDVHNHEGFTLVELIIVIAILAILSSVAVVGYSSYVEKANIQADKTLIAEIQNAMLLANYSDDLTGNCYIALSVDGVKNDIDDDSELGKLLAASFGTNWRNTLKLKYNGWNGDYGHSSYHGNETALMGRVESLTGVLGDTIADMPGLVGENFKGYMSTELGFSAEDMANSDKAADAAVLYVANGTSNLTPEQQADFIKIAQNAGSQDDVFGYMVSSYSALYGSNVMGAAAAYAMLTAYCQYEDNLAGNTNMMDALGTPDASGITEGTVGELTDLINNSVGNLDELLEAGNGLNFEKYFSEVIAQDAAAFIDVMGTVSNVKGQIVDRLGTTGCFTSAELREMFTYYADGNIIIKADIKTDGTMEITVVPRVN